MMGDPCSDEFTFSLILEEMIHLGSCPVERTDGEALVVHVQNEILSLKANKFVNKKDKVD